MWVGVGPCPASEIVTSDLFIFIPNEETFDSSLSRQQPMNEMELGHRTLIRLPS